MKTRICLIVFVLALAAGCASDEPPQSTPATVNTGAVVPGNEESPDGSTAVPSTTPNNPSDKDLSLIDAAREQNAARRQDELRKAPPNMTGPEPKSRLERVISGGQLGAAGYPPGPVPQEQPFSRYSDEPLYRERYEHPDDNGVVRVADNPVSTFSIDVDTGAYTNMRRWLNQGALPPEDAVRVEEFINYFDYDYPLPRDRSVPFAVATEIAPTPWNPRTHLLRIGIQGYQVPTGQLPAANLVFLIDVSGSMRSVDKLPLLKQALAMLTRSLDVHDRIGIVVYAGASGVALAPTMGINRAAILGALDRLEAGGSTNGAAGIRLAYQLAQANFIPGGVNRVVLATDGDFNVGLASTAELIDLIQRKREAGIALTTLGFGSGNYNDHLLERLADEGNGNYAYIDRLSEARKVLTEELSATLLTIARDVKIQVEFNPAVVAEYRLIGYENRHLEEEDFNNDQVDAGEIGAGHRVTALYEISLVGADSRRLPDRRYAPSGSGQTTDRPARQSELAYLRIRYKLPGETASKLLERPLTRSEVLANVDQASDNFRFAAAVAAFGQKLRGGQYLEQMGYAEIADLARHSRGNDHFGYRSEFLQLVGLADSLDAANRVAVQPSGQ